MTTKSCSVCGATFEAKRPTTALYCSDRCRKAANRQKPMPSLRPPLGPVTPTGVVDGIEAMLEALEEAGRLSEVDAGKIAIVRALAQQVESVPGNSALWRELRAAEMAVMTAAAHGEDVDEFAQLLAALHGRAHTDDHDEGDDQ